MAVDGVFTALVENLRQGRWLAVAAAVVGRETNNFFLKTMYILILITSIVIIQMAKIKDFFGGREIKRNLNNKY